MIMFGGILFLKGFHFLAKTRVQYLEQAMPQSSTTHGRLQALNIVLLIIDIIISIYCIQTTLNTPGRSITILFGFESGLLIIACLNTIVKYYLYLTDTLLENGLPSKGLYIMVLELICDALKVTTYISFFILVFTSYGLPLHILRYVAEECVCVLVFICVYMLYLCSYHNRYTDIQLYFAYDVYTVYKYAYVHIYYHQLLLPPHT